MAREEPAPKNSKSQRSRSRLAKVGAVYVVLAGVGFGVLLEFVPDIFDFSEVSVPRLLVLLMLLIFVGAPVVAVGYLLLNLVVEGTLVGVAWVFEVCFRALTRRLKRFFHGAGE